MNNIVIDEKVILVRINKIFRERMSKEEMYEATRGVWKVGPRRYEADYAFSLYQGIVREVFIIHQWYPACTLEYKTRVIGAIKKVDIANRWEFEGEIAEDRIRNKYLYKSVKHYLNYGNASPIVYINC
jgi:hypothetical protein